jgi:osmotically-inducible protein OsmY
MMRKLRALMLLAALPLVQGCAAVVLGGTAATAGYLVGEDRRSVGTMAEDQNIEFRTGNRIVEKFPGAHINVTAFNRMALLSGEAPSEDAKAEIERIARSVENVRGVYNEIRVGPPSTLTQRANDSYITSKVKARFLDARRFNPVHVKVVTEGGSTFLMGIVSRKEAEDATELARTTSGVQKVVRVFEYTD